ncbi:inhibitor of growth protein 1 [Scaptodrosophila lebanonensis]|uniref:Inhibitor of growth protein n=1 Tax=Drosophila lebanonensis TaxID=7225 RepID=A0A6J2TJ77_DROLE|nr:inhibitor of growth protein 1 [Scaptodrosophila lebanonensis]
MINPIATEAINSANYVDNYIDSVENLPDDVQRQLSRIRDIDVQYRGLIRDVDHFYDLYMSMQCTPDVGKRARTIARMHQCLVQAQELGDEKMQIVSYMQEIIDAKVRQLDTDQQNLDLKEDRDHFVGLDDGPPSKMQRLQSPIRDQATHGNSLNGNGMGSSGANYATKEHYVVASYGSVVGGSAGGSSVGANCGSSTPNSERSSNLSNGANGSNGNLSGCGGDLQRTGSKRSRRRNESLANNGSSIELGGNESNSANEAGGSGNGNGERKNNLASGSSGGVGQRKGNGQAAGGSLSSGAGGGNAGSGSGGGGNNSGKKKKRKVRGAGASNTAANAREETPPPEPIDPDEPTYCVCNQISFGEMILCDNDLCPIEWFHFSCVSLVLKPKGKWFCPNCRGERPNVMKPKAQFLKELERYNKEKEEKT